MGVGRGEDGMGGLGKEGWGSVMGREGRGWISRGEFCDEEGGGGGG